ncbi:hypothetical protein QTP88_015990 [Uroleucon formosanum]
MAVDGGAGGPLPYLNGSNTRTQIVHHCFGFCEWPDECIDFTTRRIELPKTKTIMFFMSAVSWTRKFLKKIVEQIAYKSQLYKRLSKTFERHRIGDVGRALPNALFYWPVAKNITVLWHVAAAAPLLDVHSLQEYCK